MRVLTGTTPDGFGDSNNGGYHKFVPNLRGRDGAHAARWLADEGFAPAVVTRWLL